MASTETSPALPLDLEREIFELCALDGPSSILRLVLVARRVNEWVRPLLYRSLVVDGTSYSINDLASTGVPVYSIKRVAALDKNSPTSGLAAVRHLFLLSSDDTSDKWTSILAACTHLDNLSLMGTSTKWIHLISSLPLKHLYAPPEKIVQMLGPTFAHLTHLEIFETTKDRSLWLDKLASLPRLTHLSFHDRLGTLFRQLLRECAGLRVLVCLAGLGTNYEGAIELAQDVRFVAMRCDNYVQDWYMGARWGEDYWHRAEIFIAKRRAGEIDSLQFEMEDGSPKILPL
ncbi:hypothetical protein C8F04DRAFT_1007792 [Mycena alexandri]|uniref:Uncharacterized protein n=1 Tax=Mycena alexandri TaxID=1745969 RepID=A0AAD6SHH8_9AGAR|nr:hypothetical protein C8F04DRAFT_1007792 [Mycena alexandri]